MSGLQGVIDAINMKHIYNLAVTCLTNKQAKDEYSETILEII